MTRPAVVLLLGISLTPWTTLAQRRVTTPDPLAAAHLVLAVDRLLADRWYPGIPRAKGDVPAAEDEALLQGSLSSINDHIRRLGVRSIGRFLNPLDAPFFLGMQADPAPVVRSEALFWYARVLGYTKEPAKQREALDALIGLVRPDGRAPASLLRRLDTLTPVDAVFEAVARLGGIGEATAIELERLWIEEIDKRWPYSDDDPQLPRASAALEQIEPLLKLFPNRALQPRTRVVLGRVAPDGLRLKMPHPSLTALEALTFAKVTDRVLAQAMLIYRCPIVPGAPIPPPTCGWQYRRQGVLLTDVRDPEFAIHIETALKDPSSQVRLEMYRRLAGTVDERKTCEPLMAAFEDASPVIQIEAIDWVSPECKERDALVRRLELQALDLGQEPEFRRLPFAARALGALARFSPDHVRKITEHMAASKTGWHEAWQYRAAAARAAGVMRDEAFAIRFADDPHTNVQFEALNALQTMGSAARWPEALKALESDDYRLVRTGAAFLRGMSDRDAMMRALVAALERITNESSDSARPARLEILARLKEIAPADHQGVVILYNYLSVLQEYLADSDPLVANAMADVLGLMYGTRPAPKPRRRPIVQPAIDEIIGLPETATIHLGTPGDDIVVTLNTGEAPFTVGRFYVLATRQQYYDDQIFYRLLPLNLIQAGSPRPNDDMGAGRFIRDETALTRQMYGQVSWWSQGPDTGDAMLFVNLLDVPARDFKHTVLGRVRCGHKNMVEVPGMDLVASEIIEGTRIKTIQFGRSPCKVY
jgi:cyclophilin family peptidyl-prolyl cis-trans isomerase/HEAT repeat protein